MYSFIISVILLNLYCPISVQPAPNTAIWKNWTFCKGNVDVNKNNECLVKAVHEAGNEIMQGSSYFKTPSLDPLHINELAITQSNQKDKAVAIDLTFNDMDITGLSTWTIKQVLSDWTKGEFRAVIKVIDPVKVSSNYKINGKMILLPISGQGKANITFFDLTANIFIKGKIVEKKGKKFYTLNTFKDDLIPKGMKINFENLFNGNKALGDNMNKFLNENWKEIMQDLRQPIGDGMGEALRQIAIRVFDKIPYDTLVLN